MGVNASRSQTFTSNRRVFHEFMDLLDRIDAKVFLIDPLLLYSLIDDKHRQVLEDRDLLPESLLYNITTGNEFCLSYGVFSDFRKDNVSFYYYLVIIL